MRQIKKGSTDRSVIIRIIDSTDGTPETGVVYNTSGIDLWYRREGAAVTSITEAELAALTTAHTDGGILHIGNGYYRLDLPDAAWATGANHVMIGGTVTGMIVIGQEIQLVNYDPEDGVRLGLTALPNAAADAAGGLPISDAGGLDLDAKLANTNEVTAARMGALTDWIDGGRLDLILDAIAADVVNIDGAAMRGTDNAALASAWTATRAGYIDLLNTYLDAAISSRLATAGYTAPDNASIALILEDTGTTIPAQISGLNNLSSVQAQTAAAAALTAYDPPTKAELDSAVSTLATSVDLATVDANVDAILEDTGTTIPGLIDAVDNYVDTEVAAIKTVTDKLDTALEADGDVYRYTTNALENSPTGSGGFTSTDRSNLEAILADTGTDGVIVATNNDKTGYGLADDAITSSKFDESTAYPLVHADSGSTAVARTGADSDTLETLSGQIDGVGSGGGDATSANQTTIINAIAALNDFDPSSDTVAHVTLVDTCTTNTDMRGTDSAYTGTPPTATQIRQEIDSNSTQLASIVADTNEIQTELADGGRTDALVDAILVIAQKIDTALELDDVVYRFTANALENSPTGTGGFTATDRSNLEAILADTGTDGVIVADVETGLTHAHAMQALFALVSLITADDGTITARDYADTKDRIVWTVDDDNNRLTVTFDFD